MSIKAYVWIDSIDLKTGVTNFVTRDKPDVYVKLQKCTDFNYYNCNSTYIASTPVIQDVIEEPYAGRNWTKIEPSWYNFSGDVYQLNATSVFDRFEF